MPMPMAPSHSTAPRGPVSPSAPMYRAKKRKPGESETQNNGRMTGPPMQQGPGQGSMFVDGRKGNPQGMMPRTPNQPMGGPGPMRPHGQPQYGNPPSPNYPQLGTRMPNGQSQGKHPRGVPTATMMADGRKPMMDDGGIGSPSPVGGSPDDDPSMTGAPTPDMDDTGAGPAAGGMPPVIDPAAVNYHDELHSCGPMAGGSGCQYFNGGQCSVLQMAVQPQSGCTAFSPMMGGGGGDQGPVDTGAGFSQNDAGTSGAPSLS